MSVIDAIIVMIFMYWFGFPWSFGVVFVIVALGFPAWFLWLWIGFACVWPVVRAVRLEHGFVSKADRGIQIRKDGRWSDDRPV